MDVCRLKDVNNMGGKIIKTKNKKVFANNKLIATNGDTVVYSNRPPTITANGSKTVFINGISINRKKDKDADGNTRINGDKKITVGG